MIPVIIGGGLAVIALLATIGGGDKGPELGADGNVGAGSGSPAAGKAKAKARRPMSAQESFLAGQAAGRTARENEYKAEETARAARQAETDAAVARALAAKGEA